MKSWPRLIKSLPSSLFLSRAHYTEYRLQQAIGQGLEQYVILGAGMDTFAFRCPELVKQIKVYEVDHPATQEFKRHRLDELGWEIPEQLHFVPVDFTQDSLIAALQHSPYDPGRLSFFSWLGVTHYLPRETVFDTLHSIADISPTGSVIIFDYYDPDAFNPEKAAKRVNAGMERLLRLGEPIITGLDPKTLVTDLQNIGLRMQENLHPFDIQERYFKGRTDGYYAYEHAHIVWAVVE